MDSLSEVQNMVLDYCKAQVSETTFNCWFKDIKLISVDGNNIVLNVSNIFKKKIINENYLPTIKDAFTQLFSFDVNIQINCEENSTPISAPSESGEGGYEYTFDTFIVGNQNRYAHAASLAVAENPAKIYNPLFIYGKSGLGKTHLLNAIAARIKQKFPEKVIVPVSCETFVNEFIYAVSHGTINSFREKYRESDILLLDDIQFIAGKVESEEEFFNTFETLKKDNKQIVITSDRPPKDIKALSDRLRGRFEQGLLTDIQPPEFETRVAILKRKAEQLGIQIPDNVNYFIADQVKSNIRQLEGVVKKLQAVSNMQEKITVASAQMAIKDIRNDDKPEPVTVRRIVEEVARTYNVQPEDIIGNKRSAEIAKARHVAVYVAREITQMSTNKLGEEFNRKHTTIIYSCEKTEELIAKNSKEKDIISDLISNLQNS